MRRLILFVVAALLLLPAVAPAQSWQLQVFQPGVSPATGAPFYTLDLPATIVTCSANLALPATPATAPVNPRELWWTQPDLLPGQVCRGDLSGQTAFIALPIGGPYPIALIVTNEAGVSPRGVGESPFKRLDPGLAPANVRLIRAATR